MYSSSQSLSCQESCHRRTPTRLEKSELSHRHMIPPPASQRRVSRRINPRESPEIIRKVRLVVIATTKRQLRPRHIHPRMKSPRRRLKAMNPAPHLRSQPHLFPKDLRQSPLAHPNRTRTLRHAEMFSLKQVDGVIDHLRSARISAQNSDQQPLKPAKLLRRTRNLAKPVDNRLPPDAVKRDGLLKEQIRAFAKKPRKSTRPNHHTHQLGQIGGIDHLIA